MDGNTEAKTAMDSPLVAFLRARDALALKVALVFISLVVALGIGEWILRRRVAAGSEFNSLTDLRQAMLTPDAPDSKGEVHLRTLVAPNPDDHIIYDLRPNLKVRFMRANVETNSCGMRQAEITPVKDANVYRIALLGDSFAFGWGVEEKQGFGHLLEEKLNRLSTNGRRFEVLNFGVPGYSTFQEVAKFKETALDFDPDAVLVFFVQNDFGMPFFVRDMGSGGRAGGLLNAFEFTRMAEKALDPTLEEKQLQKIGLDPNRALSDLAQVTRAHGIKTIVAFNPGPDANRSIKKLWALRSKKNLITANIRPGMLHTIAVNHIDPKLLSLGWDPHPSPLKHRILADLLAPYFMQETK